ncbi:MAG: butyrate kinase [Bacteroides sp.]|nr:butyrate kinase [Bacteroides sp.]MDD4054298.1 butyrate kinase [Bacteroides sp.]MDD4721012.1 butyrate kinase [Bacteroides sp.]NLI63127.1 butyrate kinase [Bacteroidales bacterium]
MKILVINPGSTSTKVAVYNEEIALFSTTITHSPHELAKYKQVIDQFDFRKEMVCNELKSNNIAFNFDAIVARGGIIKPILGGVYLVNEKMKKDVLSPMRHHACNLGCLIADEIAKKQSPKCPTFIADPGTVDELEDIARITGSPLLPKIVIAHTLNQRAVSRRYAKEKNLDYDKLNLIVAHLGGGISIGVHKKGKIIDVNNALDGEGPFSPERAGTLPAGALVDLCFSGKLTQLELKQRIVGKAGIMGHLGTTDIKDVLERIEGGDQKAKLVLDAMIYNIAKSIGALATVLKGEIDAILLTGGIAYSDYIIQSLKERIDFLSEVYVYPGEDEMEALALNAIAVLNGDIQPKEYL